MSQYVVWRSFRMTEAELLELKQAAAAYGYALSSYVRVRVFGKREDIRIVRRPTEVIALLGRLLGEFNKQGSNLNQIARSYNLNQRDELGLLTYIQECSPILDALEALLTARFRIIVNDVTEAPVELIAGTRLLSPTYTAAGRYTELLPSEGDE